jgi:broad specificity phosphatase PhoE
VSTQTHITIVRHGTTDGNVEGLFLGHTDLSLNEAGRCEVDALAHRMAEQTISAVITSDLKRARETAQSIVAASNHSPPLIVEPRLREMCLGDVDGVPAADVYRDYPELVEQWKAAPADVRMPGADSESLRDVQNRAWPAVESVVSEYVGRRVVLVSHTFTILTILTRVLGLDVGQFRRLFVGRASITEIEWADHGPTLISLNDTAHLKS